MKLTAKFEEQLIESANLAGCWHTNNQNNAKHPWGGVRNSADNGRFLYEYFPSTGECGGSSVWTTATAIMGLLTMSRKLLDLRGGGEEFREPAIQAGEYLKTLQILDKSMESNYGGFREVTPQTPCSFPCDGAWGAMGLIALYRETGEEYCLRRAQIFAEWYHRYGSDEKGWPYWNFDFNTGKGERGKTGHIPLIPYQDWQAGGALIYYQLYKLTGEKKWLEFFMQIVELLMDMHAHPEDKWIFKQIGSDNFSIAALLAAYRETKDKKILATYQRYVRGQWTLMDEDGSYPSGFFFDNFNNIEYLQLCREEAIQEDLPALEARILKTLKFGLTLQELCPREIRAYGGFYGQCQYGAVRNHIHARDTAHSILLHMRVVGETGTPFLGCSRETPYFSAWNWDKITIPQCTAAYPPAKKA